MMMDHLDQAIAKLTQLVQHGDTILVGNGTSEPRLLIAALIHVAKSLRLGLNVIQITTSGQEQLADASGAGLRLLSPAPGPKTRKAIEAGRADLFYAPLGMLAAQIKSGCQKVDGVLLRVGPASAGLAFPGLAADISYPAFANARFRMIEVDPALPRVPSPHMYDLSACDHVIERVTGPDEEPHQPPLAHGASIAGHLVECIPPGATLEVGLGRLASLLPKALAGQRGFALSTGLIGDETKALIEQGIVDRPVHAGEPALAIGSVIRGTQALYDWCDQNPAVSLLDACATHDPGRLSRLPKFTAINAALQVDLMGNANSLSIGGKLLGGLGGALDFAVAGAYSQGSIIALESSGIHQSKIVPQVERVTIPCAFVTHIVTEYGIAALSDKSSSERAQALIAIAHPDHRALLRRGLAESGGAA